MGKGRPKKPLPIVCPCNGKENWSWHRRRRLPQCQASVERSLTQKRFWIPGTSIYVPEYEEP
jgi:hypothetical protein